MSELFDTINKKYSSIKLLKVFTDGSTSQFKQSFFCFQTFMDGKMNSISKLFGISLLPHMGKEQLMESVAP